MTESERIVLLVDDDARLLRGLERHLSDGVYQIMTAVSAAEANAILHRYSVDVIVTDNQMPGVSGIELLEQVQGDYPHVARIMLTGNITRAEERRIVEQIGVYQLLRKPIPAEQLAQIITTAITESCGTHSPA